MAKKTEHKYNCDLTSCCNVPSGATFWLNFNGLTFSLVTLRFTYSSKCTAAGWNTNLLLHTRTTMFQGQHYCFQKNVGLNQVRRLDFPFGKSAIIVPSFGSQIAHARRAHKSGSWIAICKPRRTPRLNLRQCRHWLLWSGICYLDLREPLHLAFQYRQRHLHGCSSLLGWHCKNLQGKKRIAI